MNQKKTIEEELIKHKMFIDHIKVLKEFRNKILDKILLPGMDIAYTDMDSRGMRQRALVFVGDALKQIRQETLDEVLAVLPGKREYFWLCYGDGLDFERENFEAEQEHLTNYPCKIHPESSGANVSAGFNSCRQEIIERINKLKNA